MHNFSKQFGKNTLWWHIVRQLSENITKLDLCFCKNSQSILKLINILSFHVWKSETRAFIQSFLLFVKSIQFWKIRICETARNWFIAATSVGPISLKKSRTIPIAFYRALLKPQTSSVSVFLGFLIKLETVYSLKNVEFFMGTSLFILYDDTDIKRCFKWNYLCHVKNIHFTW